MLLRIAPLALVVIGCASASTPHTDPVPEATPVAAEVTPAPEAAAPQGYSGHGLESLPQGVLEKFAPKAPPAAIAKHAQQMVELYGPGAGLLTPDGRHLVFTWRVSGQQQIWRIDGAKRFPVQLTSGEDRTFIDAITPDGKTLIVSRDANGEENPGIYVLSVNGGELKVVQHVKGVQSRFHQLTRDGSAFYFTANDQSKDSYAVYRYTFATGTKETVYAGAGLWSVSDVRDDGTLLLRKAVGSLPSEYWELAKGATEPKHLFGQGENVEYEAVYGRPGEILVQTPKLGEFRRLYVWRDGTLAPLSAETNHDVSGFTVDDDKKRLVYHINDNGFTRVLTMVPRGKTWVAEAVSFLPKADNLEVAALTRGGRYGTAVVDYGDRPPTTMVIDFTSKKVETWHEQSIPEIDTATFVGAKLESYPARDGTAIPAFVRRPKQCIDQLCPVIVEFHGGPEGQYVGGFNGAAQLFVDAGFVHVAPNVRGSDGYGKTYLAADDAAKRLDIITDIEDAAIWARKTFAVGGQAPKVGIYGGSYGGYSTLVGMTMFAGAYDAGVSVVGISNLITFLNNTAPYRRVLRISEYGDPEKDHDALAKLSPSTYIDRVRAPLLILQGANDPRVPVGEAVSMYDAMVQKKLPAELMIYADEGHGASKRSNRVSMLGNSIRFFIQHLKSAPASP